MREQSTHSTRSIHMRRKLPSPQATPGLTIRIHHFFQSLDHDGRWFLFRALVWIAGASRELGVVELLSAVAADCQFSLPEHQYRVSRRRTDPERLHSLLIRAEIIFTPTETVVHRKHAKTLLRMITGRSSLDESWIHVSLAITCLRCIEICQPEAVLHTLDQNTRATNCSTARSFDTDQTSIRRTPIDDRPPCRSTANQRFLLGEILPYAVSNWHTHFKLAEQNSWRQSALVHQIIENALAGNPLMHHTDGFSVMNVGLLLCALHDFTALARTYLEMGASFDTVLNPWGTSGLHVAAACGSRGVLALGLLRQPDLASLDHTGLTALQNATLQGQCSTAEMLRMAGKDMDHLSDEEEVAQESDPHASLEQIIQYARRCSRYNLDGSSQTRILIRCFRDDLVIGP